MQRHSTNPYWLTRSGCIPVQARFRSMWERYCRGVQAIVYVVDSADLDSVDTAKKELHELLGKPSLAGIPLLVLGNKNDLPEALSTDQLINRMELQVWYGPVCVRLLCDRQQCVSFSKPMRATCQWVLPGPTCSALPVPARSTPPTPHISKCSSWQSHHTQRSASNPR